jgi:hypothetical protein
MPDEPVAIVVATIATRLELTPAAHRVVQELADEHLKAWCVVVPVDERTWAIVGTLAYEGEVIFAEFESREIAELALEELAALDPDITVAGAPRSRRE